jgi:hypothetical protein
MVRKCNLVEVEGDGMASLCVGSMRDLVSMRDCVLPPMRVPLVALYMQPVRVYK